MQWVERKKGRKKERNDDKVVSRKKERKKERKNDKAMGRKKEIELQKLKIGKKT